jgi:hypothetical protein
MFDSIVNAKDFVTNSGWLEAIEIDQVDEIAMDVYRNATDEESANAIIEKYAQ